MTYHTTRIIELEDAARMAMLAGMSADQIRAAVERGINTPSLLRDRPWEGIPLDGD